MNAKFHFRLFFVENKYVVSIFTQLIFRIDIFLEELNSNIDKAGFNLF